MRYFGPIDNWIGITVTVLIAFCVAVGWPEKHKIQASKKFRGRVKPVLTPNERPLWTKLLEVCPSIGLTPLPQMAFGGFIDAAPGCYKQIRLWRVDFVLVDASYMPVVVIELDDSSHDNKKWEDEQRDFCTRVSGIEVLRYRRHPSLDQLRQDLQRVLLAASLFELDVEK